MTTLQDVLDLDLDRDVGELVVTFDDTNVPGVDDPLTLENGLTVTADATVSGLLTDSLTLGSESVVNSWGSGLTVSNGALVASGSSTTLSGLDDVTEGTLANRPVADGTQGWYFTTDGNGVYFDAGSWVLIAENPSNILAADLGFDPATQSELDSHAGTSGAHHAKTTTAAELTDVSADSVADAHHPKTTSSEIDHDLTTNYVATEHVDHSTVSVSGDGATITGGGDLTADRTLSVAGDTNALDGSAGTDGQVWTSTGTGARWESSEGGAPTVLDLGDDGANESADLAEIATSATDPNSIFTHPTADKLLIDPGQNWPTADDVPDAAVDHDATTNYVASEHIDHSTVSVSAGNGLAGGGDLTASRTLSLALDVEDGGVNVGDGTFHGIDLGTNLTGTDNADGTVTVDATASGSSGVDVENTDGTALVAGATAIQAGTDLSFTDDGDGTATLDATTSGGSAVEVAEDGTSLTTDVTLIDVLGGLTASEPTTDAIDLTVDETEIDHDTLLNFVANEHIDHSTVSVSAGTGLSGGGDLTTSRTLSLALDVEEGGTNVGDGTFHGLDLGPSLTGADNADGTVTLDAVQQVSYEPGMVNYGSSLSNEEIYRFDTLSGETFRLDRLELHLRGGGSAAGLTVEVRDATAATQLDSVSAGSVSTAGGTAGTGNTITVRISNSTGSAQDAAPTVRGVIE